MAIFWPDRSPSLLGGSAAAFLEIVTLLSSESSPRSIAWNAMVAAVNSILLQMNHDFEKHRVCPLLELILYKSLHQIDRLAFDLGIRDRILLQIYY